MDRADAGPAPVTAPEVRARKGRGAPPLVMVTAYDAPAARTADRAGVDVILVGDSLAEVVLGYEDTLQVGMDDMAHHTAAVARARPRALVVTDMPWLSYHRAIVDAEIPVMGHLGLTPQSRHALGGYRAQGRKVDEAWALLDDAVALAEAGCFAIVLEAVPAPLAAAVTEAVAVPTIGIGAGPACDGQVLVFHDVLGLHPGPGARFVRRYAALEDDAVAALERFSADVRAGRFPTDLESYPADAELAAALATGRGASKAG
jgi:3-methyl-2-oxobutanoate hydroxymethyltransferase